MRPRLIAEAPRAGQVWPIPAGGWMYTGPDSSTRFLDHRLTVTATIPADRGVPSTDGRHLALVTDDSEIVVTDRSGRPLWRRTAPGVHECHINGDVLWTLAGDLATLL
ncbi:hypothetical protein [Actinoplanes sp. GCM10030250]|uniref:hypothetical protein n=1 Tax=Actinoplanes sp. GCM10030250 TaxID=3273376 RepID=UPI0036200DA9